MRILSNSYFHYIDFLLNGKRFNYNNIIEGDLLTNLDYIYKETLDREYNYYRKRVKTISNDEATWQDELKQLLTTSGLSDRKGNKLVAQSFTLANDVEEFKNLLIDALHNEIDKGQLAFIHEPLTKTLDNTISSLYKTLVTRTGNNTLKITKTKISGSNTSTIEGWITEIAQGIASPDKKSTAKTKLQYVADYEIEGLGLEETKRGIKADYKSDKGTGNILLDSQFHIGSFTTTTIAKGYRLETLRQLLAECVADIIVGTLSNNKLKIAEARKIFFRNFSMLIVGYLSDRLLGHTNSKEIFYFASGTNIMLGSEFISAIAGLNKMYIYGSANPKNSSRATISKEISIKELTKIGLDILDDIPKIKGLSFDTQLDFSKKSQGTIAEKVISEYKGGSFLTYGKFDLWYGKKK